MADASIQNAFIEGINEVFSIMFTEECVWYRMDQNSSSPINIYKEQKEIVYFPPIKVVAKVVLNVSDPNNAFEENKVSSIVTIPTKQLIENSIPFYTEEDIKSLEKGYFKYSDITLNIDSVTPKTLVADIWQMFEFKCSKVKRVL